MLHNSRSMYTHTHTVYGFDVIFESWSKIFFFFLLHVSAVGLKFLKNGKVLKWVFNLSLYHTDSVFSLPAGECDGGVMDEEDHHGSHGKLSIHLLRNFFVSTCSADHNVREVNLVQYTVSREVIPPSTPSSCLPTEFCTLYSGITLYHTVVLSVINVHIRYVHTKVKDNLNLLTIIYPPEKS